MTHPSAIFVVPALALALAGCSSPAPAADDGVLSVVASTNAWGSIAEAIGGSRIEVTSIIDSPGQDPHEYEASARDQLAASRADVVLENGGGYDPFVGTLLEASGADAVVIDAVEISAQPRGDEATAGVNEHVWYDLPTVRAVAERLGAELTALDPAGAADYAARVADFDERVSGIEARADQLRASLRGDPVLVTETVPMRLLELLGLTDVTPPELPEAVEEDSDVAPAVLQDVLDLVAGGEVVVVAYNEQTATGQTERIREAADRAGVPVVPFSETLPEGSDYIEWMSGNVERVAEALA